MKRLIVVEDDDLTRKTMALYFQRAGWTVDLATSVEQAAACMETPFDVMVCDLHLTPRREAEGLEVLKAARLAAPTAPIVLLSGDGGTDLGDIRPDALLQKPVRLGQLEKVLAELLAPGTPEK